MRWDQNFIVPVKEICFENTYTINVNMRSTYMNVQSNYSRGIAVVVDASSKLDDSTHGEEELNTFGSL